MAHLVKNPRGNAGNIREAGLSPGLERSPGVGNGNLLQYSCWDNPTDRGAWRAAVHGAAKIRQDRANNELVGGEAEVQSQAVCLQRMHF